MNVLPFVTSTSVSKVFLEEFRREYPRHRPPPAVVSAAAKVVQRMVQESHLGVERASRRLIEAAQFAGGDIWETGTEEAFQHLIQEKNRLEQIYTKEYRKKFVLEPAQTLSPFWQDHFLERSYALKVELDEMFQRAFAAYVRKNPMDIFNSNGGFERFLKQGREALAVQCCNYSSRCWDAFVAEVEKPQTDGGERTSVVKSPTDEQKTSSEPKSEACPHEHNHPS